MLPGFEPGFREYVIKIPSDNHYTIAPCLLNFVRLLRWEGKCHPLEKGKYTYESKPVYPEQGTICEGRMSTSKCGSAQHREADSSLNRYYVTRMSQSFFGKWLRFTLNQSSFVVTWSSFVTQTGSIGYGSVYSVDHKCWKPCGSSGASTLERKHVSSSGFVPCWRTSAVVF